LRILLADDHALVRAGIRMILQEIKGVDVVASVKDGREALKLIEALRPDIALLDISMPGLNGIDVAEQVKNSASKTRVMILSVHINEAYVFQALRAGAAAYMPKDSTPNELEAALVAVQRGEIFLSPRISADLVNNYVNAIQPGEGPISHLTIRQREILQLIAEGQSTKQIATLLGVSIKTVETHRSQLMERLKIFDIAGLVRFAIRIGLVSVDFKS
jgi:DNA-binding NarL/FixJ family response regulator